MKSIQHQELWDRIRDFNLDDPQASTRFSDKLASQQGWTPRYTARVIEEYKRFMLLCCISPKGASPSHDVDEVWHLHLTYTANYWKAFCRDTLGKEIHHHPSKGGTAEKHRHDDWYADTLRLYEDVFNEEPPPDIWPRPARRETNLSTLVDSVNTSRRNIYWPLLVMLVPFIIPFFLGVFTPFQLTGPQFMIFYIALIGASVFTTWKLSAVLDRKKVNDLIRENYKNDADIYQLSRYVFGQQRSVQTAIVDLIDRNVLVQEPDETFTFYPSKYHHVEGKANPLIDGLQNIYREGDVLAYEAIAACYDDRSTFHAGLGKIYRSLGEQRWDKYLVGAFVIVIGIARCFQGDARNMPYEFLLVSLVGTVIIYIVLYFRLSRRHVVQRSVATGYRSRELGPMFAKPSPVNDYAFLGLLAFPAIYSNNQLHDTFRRNTPPGDTGSIGSCGSGTSCGGSSGDGSSCGGGGCGGCGGGGGD